MTWNKQAWIDSNPNKEKNEERGLDSWDCSTVVIDRSIKKGLDWEIGTLWNAKLKRKAEMPPPLRDNPFFMKIRIDFCRNKTSNLYSPVQSFSWSFPFILSMNHKSRNPQKFQNSNILRFRSSKFFTSLEAGIFLSLEN